jgi:ribulose kinase
MRGGILGLSLSTSPEDIYRATVEGVAFGTKHVLNSFHAAGIATQNLYFSGGINHNTLWLQTTADAIGYPINVVVKGNLTLLSTAAAAAVGSGAFANWAVAAQIFRPETVTVEPEPEAVEVLEERFGVFLEFKDMNQPIFQSVAEARGDG